MAPVWQGSDRYVIMLTTILPPIVLPETNLLKIHPVPSSPSSDNSLQSDRVTEREKTLRKWRWIPETAISTELLCRTVVLIVAGNGPSQSSASHFFLFCSIHSGTHLLVICYGRFAAQWNLSGVERSPCCCIDYPLTKQYRQMHFDISEIISEMVFLVTNYTRGQCHSNSTLCGKVSSHIWILHLWDK